MSSIVTIESSAAFGSVAPIIWMSAMPSYPSSSYSYTRERVNPIPNAGVLGLSPTCGDQHRSGLACTLTTSIIKGILRFCKSIPLSCWERM